LLQKDIDNNKSAPYNIIARKEWINMANQIFGIRVKDLREKSGLSMEQLATKLGVSKSRVNMWENNGTIPRGDVLIQLAKYFEVSTDYLLGNDDDSTISPTNAKLSSLQRNLGKLNEADLNRAEGMLKAVFMDIFNDEEDDDDI
jgi:transcriptional regulator with XRE-family HTH domain